MNLKSFNGSARRRGTTIAAAALSVAMVAPFVHPVVSPNAAPAAIAQDTTPDQKPSVDTRGTSEATAIRADGTWMQKQGYQGTVYLDRDSNLSDQDKADEAMAGVKVFLQYVNGKGQVSPIYYTTSDSEGKFVFDLSNAPKDGLGNPIEFKLAGDSKFQVRTWAENPDPAKYTLTAGGDMYSGRFHNRLTRKWESWDFTAGINRIVGAKVVFQERPNIDGWLAKPEAEWTEAPTADKKWPEGGIFGTARGSVWWENNEAGGTLAQIYFKGSSDRAATDVKVVGSYVNDEVARQFDAWKDANKNYTREQFRVAQKEIVDKYQAEHGEGSHIAESRVAYVKDDGSFYLPFAGLYGVSHTNKGNKTTDEEWGKLVSAEEEEHGNLMQWNGTLGQRHRHINTDYMYLYPVVGENRDLWMGNYQDNMFQPSNELFLGQANTSANISVQNFALLTPRPIHDVFNYDNASAIAAPGDTAKSKTTGLVPNQEYAIEWFADGESTGEVCTVTANELGELESCDFTVPNGLSKPTVYSSQVFAADASGKPTGTLLLADSFLADPTVVNYDETKGTAKEKDLEVKPSFDNPNTDAEEKMPEGATFEFVDPAAAEKLGLKIDATTGVITWPADKQVEGQNEALVKVTWTPAEGADPVSREVPAKFDLDAPAAKDNETFEPGYEDGSGKPGEDVTVPAPEFKDKDGNPTTAPDGTTFKPGENAPDGVKVDPNTGEITVTVPEDAKPGDKITVPVEVTYPDGSKDNVDVTVTVEQPDAPDTKQNEEFDPVYDGGTGKPGEDVKIDEPTFKDKDGNPTTAPDGTTFTPGEGTPDGVTIDENTGEITVTIPEDATPGDKITVPVEVTYPDGSTDEVDVTVTVTEKDATPVTPVAPTENNPSTGASADDPASCEEPPYVTVEETEGVEYKVTVDGKELTPDADGKYVYDYGQTVKVEAFPTEGFTFPEGAQTTWTYTTQQNEVCDAPDTKQNETFEPGYEDGSGKPGEDVTVPAPEFKDKDGNPTTAPDGTTFKPGENAPDGVKVDPNTGEITVTVPEDAKPGDKITVPVEVTYPDGSKDNVDVTVTVEQPDAPADKPDWKDGKGKPGDKVEIPNTGGPVEDGTTVETEGPGKAEIDEKGNLIVDIDKNAEPGKKVVVVVKDKDGKEIDRVEVEVQKSGGSSDGSGSSDLSSKDNQRCINTGLGVGIPLLFLIPVGLASQMNIPGLKDFVAPINKQIRDLNTQLQKQAGVFNGPLAGKMAGIDAQLKRFGVDHQQAAGAVALIAAGALAIGLIADACAPGAGSSNGSSSSK